MPSHLDAGEGLQGLESQHLRGRMTRLHALVDWATDQGAEVDRDSVRLGYQRESGFGWYARRRSIPFLHLSDLVCSVAPIGLLLGRIANFINGELWGRISTVPWAVIFPESGSPGMPLPLIPPRHPSQLYEAALEGLVLLVYLQARFWKSSVTTTQPGRLAGEYLVGYAIARVVCEQFREPDASLLLGLSRGTLYSLIMVVSGVLLLVRRPRTPA